MDPHRGRLRFRRGAGSIAVYAVGGAEGGARWIVLAPVPMQSEPNVLFARWYNLLMAVVHEPEQRSTFALLEENGVMLMRQYPLGIGVLFFVTHNSRPPPGYLEQMGALVRGYRDNMLGIVGILEAEGFSAATQRSVGTALVQVAGIGNRFKVVQTIDQAVPWLATRLALGSAEAAVPQALRAAMQSFRSSAQR